MNNDTAPDPQSILERGYLARDEPQATAPIELTEMDEPPSAVASQDPQWPLNTNTMEAIQESQVSQSTKDNPLETNPPETIPSPTAAPIPTPLREPLAITSANVGPAPGVAPPHPLTREKTGPAIGPPLEKPIPPAQESELVGSSLLITLLLTNGARHPFKIDEKYMKKRNVNVDRGNPVNMSIYTLKELIWREWRDGKFQIAHGGFQHRNLNCH